MVADNTDVLASTPLENNNNNTIIIIANTLGTDVKL